MSLRDLIGRTADYIVNERKSAILHTVVSDTLEAFAYDANEHLRARLSSLSSTLHLVKEQLELEDWWHNPQHDLYELRFVIEEALAEEAA